MSIQKSEQKKIRLILFISLLLLLALAITFTTYFNNNLFKYNYWKYEKPALLYLKELDENQTYKYMSLLKEPCQPFTGCIVEITFKSEPSDENIIVIFRSGEIVPMAKAK